MTEQKIMDELKKSEFVPTTVEQLAAIFVDGSGSMKEKGRTGRPKGEEVKEAVRGFLERLKSSKFSKSFYIACSAFDTKVVDLWRGYKFIEEVDPNEIPNPVDAAGGGATNITLAIERAGEIADKFAVDENLEAEERVPVIILLTDGKHNTGGFPDQIADKINSKYTLATVAYGEKADENLLKDIAKSEEYFVRTNDPEELRNFFYRSSTLARLQESELE